jgi:alcohol dehydrogenase (nicotinoprotein)
MRTRAAVLREAGTPRRVGDVAVVFGAGGAIKAAVDMTGKAGTVVITGVGYHDMVLPGGILIGYHRKMQGSLFGGAKPALDIPMILGLWHEGRIKLSELITKKYSLDEINEGYQDLMDGKNIRGVLVHEH